MSHSRKLIVPALAAMTVIGFMSLGASAGPTGDNTDGSVMVDAGLTPPDQVAEGGDGKNNPPPGPVDGGGGAGGDDKNNPPPGPVAGGGDDNNNPPPGPVGGDGGDDKNNPPPQQQPPMGGGNDGKNNPPPDGGKNNPPPQNPAPHPHYGSGKNNGGWDGGFGHMARRIACYNGYQILMVRDIRECGFGIQRRVAVGGGYRHQRAHVGYAYGGGYSYGGGYANGGGYVHQQPIVRYYKPASRAAVMQAEKRARRAAQYNYGAGYGYDNGGYAGGGYAGGYVGGYGYGNGGYSAQMGYGEGLGGGHRHKAKRGHRRQGQAYGMMGGYGAGYGYDAGYGAGFGYGGTTIHYGPIMTKDGAY